LFNDISVTISGVSDEGVKIFLEIDFWKVFHPYHYRANRKKTEVLNEDAVKLLSDSRINTENSLVYLDPPYIATSNPYSGKKGKFSIQDLLRAMVDYKGHFIFSHRAAVYKSKRPDVEDKKTKEGKFRTAQLLDWFRELQKHRKTPLYVLFGFSEFWISLENTISRHITDNKIFEVMITDFDFKLPRTNIFDMEFDISDAGGGGDDSDAGGGVKFYKMTLNDFNALAVDDLLTPLEDDYSETKTRDDFVPLF
jgi:hypothetical protein